MRHCPQLLILMILAVYFPLSGCSEDKQVFHSTIFLPTSVSVKDLVSKEIIWNKAIPVEHTLTMDFDQSGDFPPLSQKKGSATTMRWWIKNTNTGRKVEGDLLKLPGIPVMIERTHRTIPELPEHYIKSQEKRQAAANHEPAEATLARADKMASLADEQTDPEQDTTAPDDTTVVASETASPADKQTDPEQDTTAPDDTTVVASETASPSNDQEAVKTNNDVTPPADETDSPSGGQDAPEKDPAANEDDG